jgi:hypothetical protein
MGEKTMISDHERAPAILRKAGQGGMMDNLGAFFREHKYAVIDDFLPALECRELLHAIDQCKNTIGLINVKQASVTSRKRFLTLNGEDVEQNIPTANQLYARINELVNQLSGNHYAALENKQIGLSINVTPSGGTFSWHHDRHEITAILYLNEVESGGELEFFPNNRILLKNNREGIKKWIQLGIDGLVLVVSKMTRRKVTVTPKPGVLCIMVGTRCTHRVRSVIGDRERVCMIFAYDVPGKDFSRELTTDYYGYKMNRI